MKENPFPYSIDNKRYHTLHYHNLQQFGGRVYKAVLDVGCSCPNIDGTKGRGGCLYCSGGAGYFTASPAASVTDQLTQELARIRRKAPGANAVAYFQAHSNTYGAVERLRPLYEEALRVPGIVGLAIATRPDCLPDEMLDCLQELRQKTSLSVELGLQSVHARTSEAMNIGRSYEEFLQGYEALQERGIRCCVHIIDGLPGEGRAEMLATAGALGRLRPQGVKIHLLHVLAGTPLAAWLADGRCVPMEKDAYVETVVEQLELLPPETVVERLTGDGDKRQLLAPLWSRNKIAVLAAIDRLQAERDTWQGRLYRA